MEHLIERGHVRIAFIGGPIVIPQVRDRHVGAGRAMTRAGLPASALTLIPTTDLTVAAGLKAGEKLLGMSARRRPTAVFCANDLIAVGLLQQLTQQGVAVPDDIAIIGYDDIEYAAAAAVPLSSVAQPRPRTRPGCRATADRGSRAGRGAHAPAGGVHARARCPGVDRGAALTPAARAPPDPTPGARALRWAPLTRRLGLV